MTSSCQKIEHIKSVTRSRKSKKARQYNGQMKRENKNLQSTTQKTKDGSTKSHGWTRVIQTGKQWFFTSDTCRATGQRHEH